MKLRTAIVFVIAVSVSVFAFTVLNSSNVLAEDSKVLRMAYPSSDRGFAPEMIKWWGEHVEKATNGKIKVEYYWGGILGSSKEMLYAIEKGTCDVGVIFPMYFSTELPLASANTCLISTFQNDPVVGSRAWKKLAQEFPEIPQEWKNYNQKLLMGWEVGPYLWVSTKPLKDFQDLNNLKLGVWGGKGPRELAKDMGSIPRSIPSVEVYDALDKATIDARAETLPMVITYKHYEICDYVTDVGSGTTGSPVYAMSINLDTWNSLSNKVQKQILDVTDNWWNYFEKRVTEAREKNKEFLKKNGMKFLEFSDKDKQKVRNLPVYDEFRQKYIERADNHELAAKIFDRYREIINELK